MKKQLVVLGIAAVTITACTRESREITSGVHITMPSLSDIQGAQGTPFPANSKVCFGVQVSAPDIPQSQANSCSPSIGQAAGFVAEGETVTLTVQKGSARKFELMAYITQPDQPCPLLDAAFLSTTANQLNTYVVGRTEPLELAKDEETISIAYQFPGTSSSIATTVAPSSVCASTAGLKGYVTSNGDVFDATAARSANLSSPINEAFFMTGLPDARATGTITSSSVLNWGTASEASLPVWLHSLTRKPDTGKYYALDEQGQIYEVSFPSSGNAVVTPQTAPACPFATADCRVPVWMQSISAGFGTQLYSIDHGGQAYSLESGGPSALSLDLGPTVSQIAFY